MIDDHYNHDRQQRHQQQQINQEINNNEIVLMTSPITTTMSSSASEATIDNERKSSLILNNNNQELLINHHHQFIDDNCLNNDLIELYDENNRLKKQYEKLRYDFNELDLRYDLLLTENLTLKNLLQQKQEKLLNIKKLFNNSIDLNEYEQIKLELEHSNYEYNELLIQNKLLRKELNENYNELNKLQQLFDEQYEQNQLLREQIIINSENREMTTKLLCDIELMQTKINEYLISINDLSDENQELRRLLDEQYNIKHNKNINNDQQKLSSTTTITSHCPSYTEVMMMDTTTTPKSTPATPTKIKHQKLISTITTKKKSLSKNSLYQNSDNYFANEKLNNLIINYNYNRCSYSNLNNQQQQLPRLSSSIDLIKLDKKLITATNNNPETMADVIIDDLEQQMNEMKSKITSLEMENKQLKLQIQQQQLIESVNNNDNEIIDNNNDNNENDNENDTIIIDDKENDTVIIDDNNENNDNNENENDDNIRIMVLIPSSSSSPIMEDRSIQTDPITLTIENKKFIRCPFDHSHNGINLENIEQNNSIIQKHQHQQQKRQRRRFLSISSLVKSKSHHHHHPYYNQTTTTTTSMTMSATTTTTTTTMTKTASLLKLTTKNQQKQQQKQQQQQIKKKRKRKLFCLF